MKQRFVLDTTAITDTGLRQKEGYETLCESAQEVLDLIAKARLKFEISCYIPYPTVYSELVSFLKRYGCVDEVFIKLDTWLVKKTPNRYEVKIPAAIFYEYVLTMREKINRGRKLAEEFIWESSAITSSIILKEDSNSKKEEIQQEIGSLIGRFRDKYKTTLRQGILDSSPDLDVLLLAKELEAGVVSSDIGIRKWSERMGLRYVEASKFPRMLKEYLTLIEK
ncbi:MAG: RNA ligase partner protein [Archaeoglobus sp.]|jgi:RNA ligase partner protein|nr:MAG: RNA ligase partner protein [Archaeoglobus sp.]